MEEASGSAIDIWPDNWDAVILFDAISTQWRVGAYGPTGLDYNVLYHKLDRMNLSAPEYDDMELCISTLESAALETMRKKHEQ